MQKISTFKLETTIEADEYLKDLLAKPENRSLSVVNEHAQLRIDDEGIKAYFIESAEKILKK